MFFGNIHRFAIELAFDNNTGEEWMFGRVCYWICGERVGDYESGTSLRDFMFALERISGDADKRENEYLWPLITEILVNTLQESMFGSTRDNDALERRAIQEHWATHNINPAVDIFDEWSIYLVENDCSGRCVCLHHPTTSYNECFLARGEFDSVVKTVLLTLLHKYDQSRHLMTVVKPKVKRTY